VTDPTVIDSGTLRVSAGHGPGGWGRTAARRHGAHHVVDGTENSRLAI